MAKTEKKELMKEILVLNPNMKKVGSSDVWMGKPDLSPVKGGGFKMVNMTITLPAGAKMTSSSNSTARTIERNGAEIKVWQP